jgi:SAM-dependent MidA family methyltransferase
VQQAVKTERGWRERRVAVDENGKLAFAVASDPTPHFERLLPQAARAAPEGAIAEWRAGGIPMELGRRIGRGRGAALVMDYGHAQSAAGETLQAVGRHAYADPLSAPGEVDLTAHVDFQALAQAVEPMGAETFGPVSQGQFLRRLGIEARAAALKARAAPAVAADIDSALARLTGGGRTGMGELFKAVAFAHRSVGTPPGFD